MVRLTPAGEKAISDAAPKHVETVQRHFFDLLSSEELDTLAAVYDRLLDNLEHDDP
jgi:DNA-binding MarR family transcriptional regulator